MIAPIIDTIAAHTWFDGLKRRPAAIRWRDGISLIPLFFPGLAFVSCLLWAKISRPDFAWLGHPLDYPWQLWAIALCGSAATLGGIGDWLFHRLFYSVGRGEKKSHLLALVSGGIPLFLLMTWASVISGPGVLLIPILLLVLYTTVLICYDEFVFHRKRCKAVETLMHRVLVFGNGTAWLAWMHWCFA